MSPGEKTVIGGVCPVTLNGQRGSQDVLAKIDTGAARTSVDTNLAAKVGLGPVTDTVKVRAPASDHSETRPLVQATIDLSGLSFELPVSITDRQDMKYPVIIGMDILSRGDFLIDASKGNNEEGQP